MNSLRVQFYGNSKVLKLSKVKKSSKLCEIGTNDLCVCVCGSVLEVIQNLLCDCFRIISDYQRIVGFHSSKFVSK